jgi:hypothetical protein
MNGIVEGIIGGTITVTNYEAFNSLIVQYPDNPDLYYVYADLLKNNFQKQSAAGFYEKAAHFSLSSGNLIKAIISQAQKWRLSRPKHQEIEYFFLRSTTTVIKTTHFIDFLLIFLYPKKSHSC